MTYAEACDAALDIAAAETTRAIQAEIAERIADGATPWDAVDAIQANKARWLADTEERRIAALRRLLATPEAATARH